MNAINHIKLMENNHIKVILNGSNGNSGTFHFFQRDLVLTTRFHSFVAIVLPSIGLVKCVTFPYTMTAS